MAQPHRKVSRVHLVGERGLQRFGGSCRPNDRQVRARHERRQEEWEALDVVEVCVRDEKVGLERVGRTESIAQLCDP